ncbi:MAG TPA: GNAT family N-acetyltransferase [Bacteroidia bacterium]|nr:GNAT family N-acetyltransferase [Bacteroidia bacterium]
MQIKEPLNRDEFFQRSESVLGVMASKDWLNVYGQALKLKGIYTEDNKLLGGYFYMLSSKFGLKHIKCPPYTPHCGFFFEPASSNPASRHNALKEAMHLMALQLKAEKAKLITLAFPPGTQDLQNFIWDKYKVIPNYTYQISLQNRSQEIAQDFDSKTRNSITRAGKDNTDIRFNTEKAETCFRFFNTHLHETGASVYPQYLQAILTRFATTGNSFHFSAYSGQDLVALVFCVFDQNTCYYMLGASDKSKRPAGLNALLISKCIEQAQRAGCAIFDFEGSMLKGVEKFFRGFGGELLPYFTVNKATLPLELLLKFFDRERF